MFWIPDNFPGANRRRKSDRDGVELPVARRFLELGNEIARLHLRAGIELTSLRVLDHQLDVGAADIDDQGLAHRICRFGADALLAKADGLTESLKNSFFVLAAARTWRPAFND